MTKLQKIEAALEREKEKLRQQQTTIRDLERQRLDEENIQIVQAVRKLKIPLEELDDFLSKRKNNLPEKAVLQKAAEPPKAPIKKESEDKKNEDKK